MYDLTAFSLKDMTTCGAALRRLGAGATSMETVAERTVRYLYDHLVDAEGARATAMVRFFITKAYCDLNEDLQRHVDRLLGKPPADPALKCQTLLATVGDNPAWHSRHNSRYYKVHPLSREIVADNPMFAQVSEVFGIVLDQVVAPDPELVLDPPQETYNILHVYDARDSDYVPDQTNFVIPYGIRSVLVFFSLLPSGNIFSVVIFTKVAIERELTDTFRPLTLNIKMAVLPFDGTAVFATDAPVAPEPAQQAGRYKAQAESLAQLLTVHERVVVTQSERIEQIVAELERQLAENVRLRQQAAQAAVLEERRRLARDLHDSVTQALYSQTLYGAAAARQLQAGNTARAASHVAQLEQTAQQALSEMRLLIFELRPPSLANEGLLAALRLRLESVEARTGVETVVTVPDDLTLSPATETGLYWIAQEALNNVLKHAQADRIVITLTQSQAKTMLTIEDNGVGFTLDDGQAGPSSQPGALGLRGMRERAEELGWRFTLRSAPARGTSIQIEVPHG